MKQDWKVQIIQGKLWFSKAFIYKENAYKCYVDAFVILW